MLRTAGPLGRLPLLSALGFLLSMAAMIWVWREKFSSPTATLILFGMLARLLFMGYPVSDDYHRYAWEGMIQTHGYNPYAAAPDAPELSPLRDANWKGINHPELPSIYPPIPLLLMKLLAPFYPSPEPFRLVLILFELTTLLLIAMTLRRFKKPARALALYALNPFVIIFLAGEAHMDGIQVTWIAAALYFFSVNKFKWTFLFLGMGMATKYLALLFVPVFIHKKSIPALWLLALPLVFYLPFLEPGAKFFDSLAAFSTDMTFNAPIYYTFKLLTGKIALLWIGCLFTLLTGLHLLTDHRRDKNVFWTAVLFLCLAPTVHPWYLALALAFLPFVPQVSFLLLTAAMFLFLLPQYTLNVDTGVWAELPWTKWAIWLPFFLVALWERKTAGSDKNKDAVPALNRKSEGTPGFSVVIPTLNEGGSIEAAIKAARAGLGDIPHDIMVVDGGSDDNTVSIAEETGAIVYTSPEKGRGYQLHYGLQKAVREFTLFQHADTTVKPETYYQLHRELARRPDTIGGWHRMIFESPASSSLKIIQRLNNFRARYLGIAFGDQLQFLNTEFARRNNLLEPMPLMEDVYLSLKIKEYGEPLVIHSPVIASTRKWDRTSVAGNAWLVVRLVIRFLFQMRMGTYNPSGKYYVNRYYKR